MIKIALVSPSTLPFYCGNSILAERLRKGLISRGYNVVLFNSVKNNPAEAIQFSSNIVHSFNADRPYNWMQQLRNLHRVPWVITLTGTDYNSWIGINNMPLHIKENLENADALVVFHEEVINMLCNFIPRLINKIHIIPQGVEFLGNAHSVSSIRGKYGLNIDHVIFLMVSGIRPVKNIQCAIEAFHKIGNQITNVTLLHVGPIIDKEEAKCVLEHGKKLKSFKYLGEMPHIEVRELMGAVDVLLNTSLHEGMSGAILEAMYEGLPVIASSVAGNRSLIKDGINGLLFQVNNIEALTQAVMKLLIDPLLRKVMGNAGKNIIALYHSEKNELDLYERIYKKLL